jgi:hypothetical protein
MDWAGAEAEGWKPVPLLWLLLEWGGEWKV